LDAVVDSTPDHSHAPATIRALRAGKHVYCQKPLTHTVWEARQLRLAAEEHKCITQMGNQIHSASEYRTAVHLLRSGAIGKVKAVHSWVDLHGHDFSTLRTPPKGNPTEQLNWNLWQGPAATAAQEKPEAYHPFIWRAYTAFGSGALGDFGCHILDPVFTGLGIREPLSIKARCDAPPGEKWPVSQQVDYRFVGTESTLGREILLTWYDGLRMPEAALSQLANLPPGTSLPKKGSLLVGEDGSLVIPHVGMPWICKEGRLLPEKIQKQPGANHYHAWVDAVFAGSKTSDGFDYAGPLTEAVQLGNVAARFSGEELKWNMAALEFTGKPEANKWLTKEYRKGYEV
jgi:predicted dehydrogenase